MQFKTDSRKTISCLCSVQHACKEGLLYDLDSAVALM